MLVLAAGLTPAVHADAAGYRKADDGARITKVYRRVRGGPLMDVTVVSPALGSTRKIRLIVPKTWSPTAKRTWPVVYAFHGGNADYRSWTDTGHLQDLAKKWDVIVVMPEGGNGSYTDWYNHGQGGTPKWETWHTMEVRQLMERNFRVGGARAAIGLSSGGQGAITYAFRHPGMFRSASSYSGVLSLLPVGVQTLLIYIDSGVTPDPFAIWGDPISDRLNWVQHDPASNVARLRGTRLYVSSGGGSFNPANSSQISEFVVRRSDEDFLQAANASRIPVITHLYGGGAHSWYYWIREVHADWPGVMRAIGARKL
jgi:S-formylglutathione hydrolase FrmB